MHSRFGNVNYLENLDEIAPSLRTIGTSSRLPSLQLIAVTDLQPAGDDPMSVSESLSYLIPTGSCNFILGFVGLD